MQSTGHTSTQAVSLVSIHGSVMMNGMLACLRCVSESVIPVVSGVGPKRSAVQADGLYLYLDHRQKHHRAGRFGVAHRLVERQAVAARIERHRCDARLSTPAMDRVHDQPGEPAPPMPRLGVN